MLRFASALRQEVVNPALRDRHILLRAASRYANATYDFAIDLDRQTAAH